MKRARTARSTPCWPEGTPHRVGVLRQRVRVEAHAVIVAEHASQRAYHARSAAGSGDLKNTPPRPAPSAFAFSRVGRFARVRKPGRGSPILPPPRKSIQVPDSSVVRSEAIGERAARYVIPYIYTVCRRTSSRPTPSSTAARTSASSPARRIRRNCRAGACLVTRARGPPTRARWPASCGRTCGEGRRAALVVGSEPLLDGGLRMCCSRGIGTATATSASSSRAGGRSADKGTYRLTRDDVAALGARCLALWVPPDSAGDRRDAWREARFVAEAFGSRAWIAVELFARAGDAAACAARGAVAHERPAARRGR